jgi:hypothetical protein
MLCFESLHFLRSSKGRWQSWRLNDVAAFCACCGAEITLKAEACPVCGAPRHGMLRPDLTLTEDVDRVSSPVDAGNGRRLCKPLSHKRR